MQFFVLNLDRSPMRLAYMQEQAPKVGLEIERIVAVDGDKVPAWLAAQFQKAPLLSGEIGCYASHLIAAKTIVDRSIPFAIVCEDDVRLSANFTNVVRGAIAAAPADWDIIHLTEYNLRTLVAVTNLDVAHQLVRYSRLPKNTAAYLISNAGARKWLRPTSRSFPCDVDLRYAWRFNFNVVGVYPPIAFRSDRFVSDIDKTGAARVRNRKRKWAPSLTSRLYGAIWQTYWLGIRNMIVGQMINARNALRRRRDMNYRNPIILAEHSIVKTRMLGPAHGVFEALFR